MLALSVFALLACNDNESRNTKSSLTELQVIELSALRFAMMAHAESGREREYNHFYVIDRREFLTYLEGFTPTVAIVDDKRFGRKNGVFLELTTGKKAKLWEIGKTKIDQESASVWITWYSASLAGGGLAVKLEKIDGEWIPKSIVKGPIS